VITIAGRSFTVTGHDVLMTIVSVVTGLVFWIALYFSRKRIVELRRSAAIDQFTSELARIADALERIANRPADRPIMPAAPPPLSVRPSLSRESRGVAHSMFGR
jgi:hypothetical protein